MEVTLRSTVLFPLNTLLYYFYFDAKMNWTSKLWVSNNNTFCVNGLSVMWYSPLICYLYINYYRNFVFWDHHKCFCVSIVWLRVSAVSLLALCLIKCQVGLSSPTSHTYSQFPWSGGTFPDKGFLLSGWHRWVTDAEFVWNKRRL